MIFSHVLYQLSYLGETNKIKVLAENRNLIKRVCVRIVSANPMRIFGRKSALASGRGYSMIWGAT